MATSHLNRKEIKRPDAFLSRASDVLSFINENSRLFVGLIAALFLLGLGAAFYANVRASRNEQANSALYRARSRNDTAAYEEVATKHPGSPAAYEAEMALGDLYASRHDATRALEHYHRALPLAGSRFLKAASYHAAAYAHEDLKQYDAAIESLQHCLATGEKGLRVDALAALARNYVLKGDKARAAEQYELILKEFPNTPAARTAEVQKNLVK